MPWARFEDRFPWHRKIRKLSDAAFRLHVSGICWSAEHLADGYIPPDDLQLVSDVKHPQKVVGELVRHGLWNAVEDGWCIHDYHDYQPTSEHVRIERKKAAERQRRARERSVESRQESRRDIQGDDGRSNGGSAVPPTRPDPLRTTELLAPGKPAAEKTSKKDELWETLMAVCSVDTAAIPKGARGAYNRAASELRQVGATPAQVTLRARKFARTWPEASLTPTALARRWPELNGTTQSQSGPSHPPPREALARLDALTEQDRAQLGRIGGMPS